MNHKLTRRFLCPLFALMLASDSALASDREVFVRRRAQALDQNVSTFNETLSYDDSDGESLLEIGDQGIINGFPLKYPLPYFVVFEAKSICGGALVSGLCIILKKKKAQRRSID